LWLNNWIYRRVNAITIIRALNFINNVNAKGRIIQKSHRQTQTEKPAAEIGSKNVKHLTHKSNW